MKRFVLLGLLAGCASSSSTTTGEGGKAPAFQLAGLDGATVKSDDLWAGRPVLVVFMTSW